METDEPNKLEIWLSAKGWRKPHAEETSFLMEIISEYVASVTDPLEERIRELEQRPRVAANS